VKKIIKFTSKMEDGNIKVPQKYADRLRNKFRVLIIVDEGRAANKQDKTCGKKRVAQPFRIKTKNFIFDRDDVNKR